MIRWAAHRPAVVWAGAITIVVTGAIAFTRLALATKTSVEFPRLSVSANWGRASPELMEMYVTSPIEAAVQGVRGIRKTSSTSSEGLASISATLDPDADVQLTRLAILERMEVLRADSAFPDASVIPSVSNYVPDNLTEPSLLTFRANGPYTPGALQKIVNDRVVPRLAAVPGVGSARASGGIVMGIAMVYDPTLLRQLDIRPEALSSALSGSHMVQALGDEVLGASVRHVVVRDEPSAVEDLAALPVRNRQGRLFHVGELARLTPDEDANGAFNRIDGMPAMIMSVSREPNADAIKTAAAVRAALDEVKPTLPAGIQFSVIRDESVSLAGKLGDLEKRGAIAFIAVTLVLLLTLRNLRAVALVMGTAAVAIAGTALGLYIFHVPANMLTLAGLGMGIGILVQDAIVVVDRLATVADTPDARATAAIRIFPAILGATMTTIVVLIPFLYLQGNARAEFFPFAAAFALALVWSVFAAVVMVPAIGRGHGLKTRQWKWGFRAYSWILRRLVVWRWVTVVMSIALVSYLSWHFYKKVPRYSWGSYGGQSANINVSIGFPRGSNPENLDKTIQEFEHMAVGQPGVEHVTVNGTPTRASMSITFTEDAEQTAIPAIMYDEMTNRGVLIGGATVSVSGNGTYFSSGGGSSSSATFRIKVFGYSYDGVLRLAGDLRDRLQTIPRVNEVRISSASYGFGGGERAFMVTLTPDREALARYGVSASQFSQAVAREVGGAGGATKLTIAGEEVRVSLKSEGARERTLDQLREASVPTADGAPVRIGDLAALGEQESLTSIDRENQQYVRMVTYDVRGSQKLANRIHKSFMASIAVPAGYAVDDSYSQGPEDNSDKGLWMVFGIGILLVVLAVAMVFDSVWAAWMVLISLPLALAGVMAAFIFAGAAFNREAAVGVILVVGLAVHQGILLIDAALAHRRSNQLRFGRGTLRARDAFRAGMDRAGMITIVTLSTLASLLPLAVHAKSTDIFGGIALATAGGTIAGTLGAMLVMPPLAALAFGRLRDSINGVAADQ